MARVRFTVMFLVVMRVRNRDMFLVSITSGGLTTVNNIIQKSNMD